MKPYIRSATNLKQNHLKYLIILEIQYYLLIISISFLLEN